MATATLSIEMDAGLKEAAQEQAARIGVSLSTLLSNYLSAFAEDKSVVFEKPLIPNKQTAKELDEAIADIKAGRNILHFETTEEADAYLMAL